MKPEIMRSQYCKLLSVLTFYGMYIFDVKPYAIAYSQKSTDAQRANA